MRDIFELVDHVAHHRERVILTSRGEPKAVLVSLADYGMLKQSDQGPQSRRVWLTDAQALAERIQKRRGNQEIDIDTLFDEDRTGFDE